MPRGRPRPRPERAVLCPGAASLLPAVARSGSARRSARAVGGRAGRGRRRRPSRRPGRDDPPPRGRPRGSPRRRGRRVPRAAREPGTRAGAPYGYGQATTALQRGLRLGGKAVADSGLREQIARPRGDGLELAAEVCEVEAQVLAVLGVSRPPDFLEKLPVGQDLARMPDTGGQELVLDRREM